MQHFSFRAAVPDLHVSLKTEIYMDFSIKNVSFVFALEICDFSVFVYTFCVYNRIGRTQLRNYLFFGFQSEQKNCSQDCLRHVWAINVSRDQSSDKLINFLDSQLDTRGSRLDPWDSRLDTRNYRGSRIEYRVSRLERLSTYFWAVLYVERRFCIGPLINHLIPSDMVNLVVIRDTMYKSLVKCRG